MGCRREHSLVLLLIGQELIQKLASDGRALPRRILTRLHLGQLLLKHVGQVGLLGAALGPIRRVLLGLLRLL